MAKNDHEVTICTSDGQVTTVHTDAKGADEYAEMSHDPGTSVMWTHAREK